MKKLYTTAVAAALSASAFAQFNMGVATGNWSGTNAMYLNPANIAGSRHKLIIDLFSTSEGVDNSYGTLNKTSDIIRSINNGQTTEIFNPNSNNSKTFSMMAPYAEVRGPGILYNITPNHTVALSTRMRGINQLNHFDRSIYQTIVDPSAIASSNVDLTSQNFNYTAHIWSEVGLSYGGVVYDHGNGRLKVGATVRYLGGIDYITLRGANLDAHFVAGRDSFYAANSDLEYSSNVLSAGDAVRNGVSNNSIFSQFFGAKAGWGLGGDVGVVYEFTPVDEVLGSRGDYMLRLSASVVDIGSIKYHAENNITANVTGNGYLTGQGLSDNVRNFTDFTNYVQQQGFNADTVRKDIRVYMPTRLVAGADYKVHEHYYVNATFIGSLANRNAIGNSFYNQLVITPRYDSRIFSLGLPVTYSSLSGTFKAGVGVRFTGFFFGSDDLLALVSNKQYGLNVYAGGFIPFNTHKMKDSDNDGVPDKIDMCPDVPGYPEFNGCPEKHMDAPTIEDKDNDKDEDARDGRPRDDK
jgi:hypothetical protein